MRLTFDYVAVLVSDPKFKGVQELKTVKNVNINSDKTLSDLLDQIHTPKDYPVGTIRNDGGEAVDNPKESTTLSDLMEQLKFDNNADFKGLSIRVLGEYKNAEGKDSYVYR